MLVFNLLYLKKSWGLPPGAPRRVLLLSRINSLYVNLLFCPNSLVAGKTWFDRPNRLINHCTPQRKMNKSSDQNRSEDDCLLFELMCCAGLVLVKLKKLGMSNNFGKQAVYLLHMHWWWELNVKEKQRWSNECNPNAMNLNYQFYILLWFDTIVKIIQI